MNRVKAQALFACLLIFSSFIVGLTVAQTPPPANTIQHGEGANMPTVTSQYGYFYGIPPVNITGRLFGDYAGLPLTGTTLDTGQGANELYDMDQNVMTTSGVTFATVNTGYGANELYEMNQDVGTWSNVTFNSVNATEYYVGPFNATDAMRYPVTEASYIIWSDGLTPSTYYAKNGISGQIQFSGTNPTTVIQSAISALSGVEKGWVILGKGQWSIITAIDLAQAPNFLTVSGVGPATRLLSGDNVLFTNTATMTFLTLKDMYVRGPETSTSNLFDFPFGIGHLTISDITFDCILGYSGRIINLGNTGYATYEFILERCSLNKADITAGGYLIYSSSTENRVTSNKFSNGRVYFVNALFSVYDENVFENASIVFGTCREGSVSHNVWSRALDHGIWLDGCSDFAVAHNVIYEALVDVQPTVRLIRLSGASIHNVIQGNILRSTDGASYGIREYDTSDYNIITDNDVSRVANSKIIFIGTNDKINNNLGYITENSGTATILNGTTNIVVTHGLAYTPTSANTAWTVSYLENPTNDPGSWYIDTFTATQATIHVFRDPGASNLDIAWSARRTP